MGGWDLGKGWEELFWAVFRRTTNPVALLDDDRRFVDLNDATPPVFGRSRGELIGSSVADLIKPEQQPLAERQWKDLLATGDFYGMRTFIRPDGSEIDVDLAGRLTTIGDATRAVFVIVTEPWKLQPRRTARARLTEREREIVGLIALGYDTRHIAGRLHLSPETVRTHVRNAMGRLGLHTRAQLVAVALTTEMMPELLRMEETQG